MEQEQKIDMDLIKKEIKAALVLQTNSVVKTGELESIPECVETLIEGLNVGGSTIGNLEFTAMVVGYASGFLSAKGIDVAELDLGDLGILEIVEEVVTEWASELGIDIS